MNNSKREFFRRLVSKPELIKKLLDNIKYLETINKLFEKDSAREIYVPSSKEEQEKIEGITKEVDIYFEALKHIRQSGQSKSVDIHHYDIVNHYENVFTTIFLVKEKKYVIVKRQTAIKKYLIELNEEKDTKKIYKISLAEKISGIQANVIKDDKLYLEKELNKRVKVLSHRYSNLVKIALEIEKAYEMKRYTDAQDFKHELYLSDPEEGWKKVKFVDLWDEDYIKNLLLGIPEDQIKPDLLDKEISNLIEKAEYIIFVSKLTQENAAIAIISRGMMLDNPYIAIHSIGSAMYTALKIIKEVDQDFKKKKYTPISVPHKKITNSVSKIWYKGKEGLETYQLFKRLKS